MSRDQTNEVNSDLGRFSIVPAWVLDAGVSDGAVRLYAVLAGYANYSTHKCWPSLATLARDCDCSKDTILRRRLELANAGAVTITRRTAKSTLITVRTRKP